MTEIKASVDIEKGEKINAAFIERVINDQWKPTSEIYEGDIAVYRTEHPSPGALYLAIGERDANKKRVSAIVIEYDREKVKAGELTGTAIHQSERPRLSNVSKDFLRELDSPGMMNFSGADAEKRVQGMQQWLADAQNTVMHSARRKPMTGSIIHIPEGVKNTEGELAHALIVLDPRSKYYTSEKGTIRLDDELLFEKGNVIAATDLDNKRALVGDKAFAGWLHEHEVGNVIEAQTRAQRINSLVLRSGADAVEDPERDIIGTVKDDETIALIKSAAKTSSVEKLREHLADRIGTIDSKLTASPKKKG